MLNLNQIVRKMKVKYKRIYLKEEMKNKNNIIK